MDSTSSLFGFEASGLPGTQLLEIRDRVLVQRYNECLVEIGIEPTSLAHFRIDGMGYSPEIAQEKSNPDYLSHGGISNPYGIILSPQQQGISICRPYYSFYKGIMDEIFRIFRGQIKDLTLRTACYIDFDEGISHIDSPQALLLVEGIIVRFHVIGTIADAAKRQRELFSLLMGPGEYWANNEIIEELKKSIVLYGDLRYQRMQLTNLPFTQVRSFYTSVFGGTYVFRDSMLENHILVCSKNERVHRIKNGHVEYAFSDPDLYDRLRDHKLIDMESEYYRTGVSTQKLERLAECMFVNALTAKDEEVDILSLTTARRKKLEQKFIESGKLSDVYEELLKIAHRSHLKRATSIKKASPELKKMLAHPHHSIKDNTRLVVHRLLAHLMPIDILDLFVYARETFFELYQTWPENKKQWAVELLKKQLHRPKETSVL